jgi:hypothetical protein
MVSSTVRGYGGSNAWGALFATNIKILPGTLTHAIVALAIKLIKIIYM